ncbi:MAG: carbon-nitrogen hydrolase family protein [Acidobacteria bacterium]|nr:carbon-nitrogen hydrolase family protein [Acidobacteriota bacterium]
MTRRDFVAAGLALAGVPPSRLAAADTPAPKTGVRVGMAQILVKASAADENLARAEAAVARAKALDCDFVVLPECLDLGWTNPAARQLATAIPGPFSDRLAEAARQHAIHVVAGLHERDGERLFNASVLFDDTGRLLHKHHKINELDIAWDLYTRGDSLAVAPTRFGKVAISICADNAPASVSLGHAVGHLGARMLLSPCAWAVPADYDPVKEPYGWNVWDDSYPDIARRHRMPVIGVSNVGAMEAGPWKGRLCIGSSLAVSGHGTVLARGPYGVDAEALVTVDLPLAAAG